MGKVIHNSCTVVRRTLVRTSVTTIGGDEHGERVSGERWEERRCSAPIFSAGDRDEGICRSCLIGWTHPENFPVTPADGLPRVAEVFAVECGWVVFAGGVMLARVYPRSVAHLVARSYAEAVPEVKRIMIGDAERYAVRFRGSTISRADPRLVDLNAWGEANPDDPQNPIVSIRSPEWDRIRESRQRVAAEKRD